MLAAWQERSSPVPRVPFLGWGLVELVELVEVVEVAESALNVTQVLQSLVPSLWHQHQGNVVTHALHVKRELSFVSQWLNAWVPNSRL